MKTTAQVKSKLQNAIEYFNSKGFAVKTKSNGTHSYNCYEISVLGSKDESPILVDLSKDEILYLTISLQTYLNHLNPYDEEETLIDLIQNNFESLDLESFQIETNRFPNGFDDWQETHYEIATIINNEYDSDEQSFVVELVQSNKGCGGMYELAKMLTNEFETKFKGTEWGNEGNEYLDEIDQFVSARLNPHTGAIRFNGNEFKTRLLTNDDDIEITVCQSIPDSISNSKEWEAFDDQICYYATPDELILSKEDLLTLIYK